MSILYTDSRHMFPEHIPRQAVIYHGCSDLRLSISTPVSASRDFLPDPHMWTTMPFGMSLFGRGLTSGTKIKGASFVSSTYIPSTESIHFYYNEIKSARHLQPDWCFIHISNSDNKLYEWIYTLVKGTDIFLRIVHSSPECCNQSFDDLKNWLPFLLCNHKASALEIFHLLRPVSLLATWLSRSHTFCPTPCEFLPCHGMFLYISLDFVFYLFLPLDIFSV